MDVKELFPQLANRGQKPQDSYPIMNFIIEIAPADVVQEAKHLRRLQ